jgi:hypothetical protein
MWRVMVVRILYCLDVLRWSDVISSKFCVWWCLSLLMLPGPVKPVAVWARCLDWCFGRFVWSSKTAALRHCLVLSFFLSCSGGLRLLRHCRQVDISSDLMPIPCRDLIVYTIPKNLHILIVYISCYLCASRHTQIKTTFQELRVLDTVRRIRALGYSARFAKHDSPGCTHNDHFTVYRTVTLYNLQYHYTMNSLSRWNVRICHSWARAWRSEQWHDLV